MKKYKGSGSTGVSAYESSEESIVLKFNGGRTYLYDYTKPGKEHVENMKILAAEGSGLTTYVNKHVRDNYRKKL